MMSAVRMVAGSLMILSVVLRVEAQQDCYQSLASGRRLGGQFISRRYSETSLADCADKCLRSEALCQAFSYRQADTPVNGVAVDLNCELTASRVDATGRQMTDGPGYQTFAALDQPGCRDVLPGSSGTSPMESRDCFRRVITGRQLPSSSVRYSLRSSSLSRCQQSCMDADFFCSAFSYKTEYNSNEVNCELTGGEDWEPTLQSAPLFDTYERERTSQCGYYGSTGPGTGGGDRDGCYRLAELGRAIDVQDVTRRIVARSLQQCQDTCSQEPFRCQALSYRESDFDCQLSGRRGRLHTVSRTGYETYQRGYGRECDGTSGTRPPPTGGSTVRCFRLNAPDSRLVLREIIRNVMTTTVQNCAQECKITTSCNSFSFRRDTAGSELNCEMARQTVRGVSDPSVEPDRRYDTYSREYGTACQSGGGGAAPEGHGDCYRLVGRQQRLQYARIDAVFSASTRNDCERICYMSYMRCRSYSYTGRQVRGNCALSREDAYSTRLEADRDADTYQRDFSRACQYGTGEEHNSDECFRHTSRDMRIPETRTDNRLRASSLVACQDECRRTGCNTLSYKLSSFVGEGANCRMSRDRLTSRDLIPDVEHDAYLRQDSLRCDDGPEPGPGPTPPGGGNDVCFRLVERDMRHRDQYVQAAVQVSTQLQCADECSRLRQCRTFSFRDTYSRTESCLLSSERGHGVSTLVLTMLPGWSVFELESSSSQCAGAGPAPGSGGWPGQRPGSPSGVGHQTKA